LLNERLMGRLLMNSVKVESNQVSAARLLRCKRWGETGHNSRTCKIDTLI
jgi:hypothetical protein